MVKPEKSPKIQDDANYLVVYQPYPSNADFDLLEDCVAFAIWVAVVLGSYEPVWGIHHKPTARSTVILEVDREISLNNLLGEHRWKDILKKPKEDEKQRVSQVFYSIYKTTGEAWKDHWKRIQVESDWFTDRVWNLKERLFNHPYPPSLWCRPLAEDPTGKSIACPLPGSVKPPPPPDSPLLVPGSVERVEAAPSSGGPSPGTPSAASGNETAGLSLAGRSLRTSDDEDDDDDDDEDFGDAGYAGQAEASWLAASSSNASGTAKLWSSAITSSQKAGSADVDLWAQSSAPAQEAEPLCSAHGIKCSKGICLAHQKLVKDKKRAAEVAERETRIKERKAAKKERAKASRGIIIRGKKPEEPEDEEGEDEGEQQQQQEKEGEEEKEEEPKKEEPEQASGSTTRKKERRWRGPRT
ncbi:hypothetical protein H1R20_g14286, partial [Candolleomyces eurysporus]